MRTKGTGPQGLGIKGNNGYSIGSPVTFKKHNMYSKDGSVEVAETNKEHLSLKKEGYGHDSPAKCWKTHKRVPGTKKGAKGSCEPKKK
jgi:hypothetical protein|tara:strand:- start:297 stop:560 length:264 start_codon:yes stop_codon:yes gene_type:complete